MKKTWAVRPLLAGCLICGLSIGSQAADPPAEQPDSAPTPAAAEPAAAKPAAGLLFSISKETTNITGPLRADGYVDYIAALNELNGKGVTPENNASVLIWRALGPPDIDAEAKASYFRLMGVEPPADLGPYLLPFRVAQQRPAQPDGDADAPAEEIDLDRLDEMLDEAERRPWLPSEFPQVARWLDEFDEPISRLAKASERPLRFDPLVPADEDASVLNANPLGTQCYLPAARALVARAMLRAGEGDLKAAWKDLVAIHRLARLMDCSSCLVEVLIGQIVEGIACDAECGLLASRRLELADCQFLERGLAQLKPLDGMAGCLDTDERWSCLDAAAMLARKGLSSIVGLTSINSDEKAQGPAAVVYASLDRWVAWDEVLRRINDWYDQVVRAAHEPTRAKRHAAVQSLEAEVEKFTKEARDYKSLLVSLAVNPRETTTRWVGNTLIVLLSSPALGTLEPENRSAARLALVRVGVALATYHARQGHHPERLEDLVPDYLADLPLDPFTGAPFHYRRQGAGYLLASAVPEEAGDEIVLRVPAPVESPEK